MRIERHKTIDSTNLRARALIEQGFGGDQPLLIVAEEQTAGRGRHGRHWVSPTGGLWCSLVWPLKTERLIPELGLRVGVAAVVAVNEVLRQCGANDAARLKWPNDVLINGRKAAGILIETVSSREAWHAIVGVGINVNNSLSTEADSLRRAAVSLSEAAGDRIELRYVESALQNRLTEALSASDEFRVVVQAAKAVLFGIGDEVEIAQNNTVRRGVLEELNDSGLPVVACHDGVRMVAGAGAELIFAEKQREAGMPVQDR